MKKVSLSVLICCILFSCEKDTVEITSSDSTLSQTNLKTIEYDGIVAQVSTDFPDNVASLNYYDLKKIAENSSKNLKTAGKGKSFWEVWENVKEKYPDVTNFDPKDYRSFFPSMSIDEIVENQESVLSFVEALIGYDTAVEYAKVGDNSVSGARVSSYYDEANSCEIWYFAGHARLDISGLNDAKDLSFQYAGYGALNKSDANRHAVWNVFIGKYGARRYATVSKAREVVEGLTDAHECHDPDGPDKSMDLHNNRVGLEYFSTIAERYKEGFLNYSVRVNTSDSDIFNHINALPTVQKTTVAEINSLNNTTLVKLQ